MPIAACLLLCWGLGAQGQTALADATAPPDSASLAKISTEYGDIVIYLYQQTPKHRKNFIKLARKNFYDSTTFHRVIQGFMVQGGDPNSKDENPSNDGRGGPGYTLPAEFDTPYFHMRGAVAAARKNDQANPGKRSSGSQFYIVDGRTYSAKQLDKLERKVNQQRVQNFLRQEYPQTEEGQWVRDFNPQKLSKTHPDSAKQLQERYMREGKKAYYQQHRPFEIPDKHREIYRTKGGAAHLDREYTVFGEVLTGMKVVDKIVAQPTNARNRPKTDIPMTIEPMRLTWEAMLERYGAPMYP
jgi:cyclophilin family peptidyl-prolyl cis-trans isomerase